MPVKLGSITTIIIFALIAWGIGVLVWFPHNFFRPQKGKEQRQTRIIVPRESGTDDAADSGSAEERFAYDTGTSAKVALGTGEILVAVLTEELDGDLMEEQLILYRNLTEKESPLYITYIDFDEVSQAYKRVWNAPTAATRPGTVSLYTKDLIGDRSICVLVSGMNGAGAYTLTVFRKNTSLENKTNQAFNKIAELRIDGTIAIQEMTRTQAYQAGIAKGQSFSIVAYGHDDAASPADTPKNILDQTEIIYTYNEAQDRYEQSKITRIPGTQIEQRRLRELLNGNAKVFEGFIDGLWYYVSPQGTLDLRQYLYFDPKNREIIFYGDETQQIFTWQHSNATRYGIYVTTQNISVTTLRRSLDVELESLERIRVRVFEDVRLKIGVNASWDGSYRKAGAFENQTTKTLTTTMPSYIDALYNGSIGKVRFFPDGAYEVSAEATIQKGKYSFFLLNGEELLEFRPENTAGTGTADTSRRTYLVEHTKETTGSEAVQVTGNLTLFPIRLGTQGIQRLHETTVFLVHSGVPIAP
ncbi:MAG: pallilysin-related adhesin [Treponema sp.]|jgi:hypothetical protein|nr:pallilysin-related adhesin [Treponema sp.]